MLDEAAPDRVRLLPPLLLSRPLRAWANCLHSCWGAISALARDEKLTTVAVFLVPQNSRPVFLQRKRVLLFYASLLAFTSKRANAASTASRLKTTRRPRRRNGIRFCAIQESTVRTLTAWCFARPWRSVQGVLAVVCGGVLLVVFTRVYMHHVAPRLTRVRLVRRMCYTIILVFV